MDVSEVQYYNGDGKKNLFVKKDASGKSKLTTGAKVGAGVVAGGLGLLVASKLGKKNQAKPNEVEVTKEQAEVKTTSQEQKSNESTSVVSKNNTMLYVGIGVGALVLIGVIIYATK